MHARGDVEVESGGINNRNALECGSYGLRLRAL